MANSYAAPNFNIDTDTNVAGLTVLKGSAPAATDHCFIAEGARVTFESNCSLLRVYLGDNSGGTAAVKTGHITVNAGVRLTLATTTVNSGLDGTGTTSTITMSGTSGNYAEIYASAVNRVSNYNIAGCAIYATYGKFTRCVRLCMGNADSYFDNCYWLTCSSAMETADTYAALPVRLTNPTFDNCVVAINDLCTAGAVDWLDYLMRWPIFVTNAGGSNRNQVLLSFAGLPRYVGVKSSVTPFRIYRNLGLIGSLS